MIEILKGVALEVQKAVASLVDTEEGNEFIKIGADGTPTVKIDEVAEKAALGVLERSGVPMVVVSEEAGRVQIGESPEYICVLDPVDGTLNAKGGIPLYCVSIALAPYSDDATAGDVTHGLVMNLATGDIFEAQKGKGAFFNGSRIKVKDKKILESALCVYMRQEEVKRHEKLLAGAKRIRNLGSVALELCYVAKGEYQGLVDLRSLLKVSDVAAGKIIVEEAGGFVTIESEKNPQDASILELGRVSIVACSGEKLYSDVVGLIGNGKD